jgi:serine/threonine protein kinase
MAQTILDCDIPPLSPKLYSAEFIDFAGLCLQRDPRHRPPAEVLLTAPWLQMHGVGSYDAAVGVCHDWIQSGLSPAASSPSHKGHK